MVDSRVNGTFLALKISSNIARLSGFERSFWSFRWVMRVWMS